MFKCIITMLDKTIRRFECESASEALVIADRDYPGWRHLLARSSNAEMEYGKRVHQSKEGY